jgi:hypothetical protein
MEKKFKPTKVKFHPMPIEEEKTLFRYMEGVYVGAWQEYFNKKFSYLLIIKRNYEAMIGKYFSRRYSIISGGNREPDMIFNECVKAIELAGPYLNKAE